MAPPAPVAPRAGAVDGWRGRIRGHGPGANLAFFSPEAFTIEARPMAECGGVLDDLVVRHRFTVGFDW